MEGALVRFVLTRCTLGPLDFAASAQRSRADFTSQIDL